MLRFSRTASSRNSACCLRSSGTRPMPWRMACAGVVMDTASPSMTVAPRRLAVGTENAAGDLGPARARSARQYPEFRRGAARDLFLRAEWRGSSTGAAARQGRGPSSRSARASRAGSGSKSSAAERPTIMRMMLSTRAPAAAASPPSRPSRRTVTRSQICSTSERRWVTKIVLMPSRRKSRMMANSRCDLRVRQGRGRLIHDDQPRAHGKGAGDLHHLLLSHGEIAHEPVGGQIETVAHGKRTGIAAHGFPAYEGTGDRLAAEKHILRDGEGRDRD